MSHSRKSSAFLLLACPMLVSSTGIGQKCMSTYETETGSSLLQGFSQQSQVLHMSVDPEGDGLTQQGVESPLPAQDSHHSHAKSGKHPAKRPKPLVKRLQMKSQQRSARWTLPKMSAKKPTFSGHFHAGGTEQGSHVQPTHSEVSEVEVPPTLPPASEDLTQDLTQDLTEETSMHADAENAEVKQTSEEDVTWVKSQDPQMQAAVSLAKALLSLQVTAPEFIGKSLESANEHSQGTDTAATTITTTSTRHSNPQFESSPDQTPGTWHALLETFHHQMRNNFACLLVAVINGPLQTLAILLLLFLGYNLRNEVTQLKEANAELMQKVYDVTAVPSTPTLRQDRRWFGRSDSRADWQRGLQVVGGRE